MTAGLPCVRAAAQWQRPTIICFWCQRTTVNRVGVWYRYLGQHLQFTARVQQNQSGRMVSLVCFSSLIPSILNLSPSAAHPVVSWHLHIAWHKKYLPEQEECVISHVDYCRACINVCVLMYCSQVPSPHSVIQVNRKKKECFSYRSFLHSAETLFCPS